MAAQRNPLPASRVLDVAPADPREAREHFAEKLRFETDPSDVWTDLQSGNPGFVLVDPTPSRGRARRRGQVTAGAR